MSLNCLQKSVTNTLKRTSLKLKVINFLNVTWFVKVNRTWFGLQSIKFLSARAGAVQSSSVFNCFGKGGTDQKDTEQILQHYKSRSVFSLHYFRKTFSTPFCIELTIASTFSTLLIKSKSSMSWLTEPFDYLLTALAQCSPLLLLVAEHVWLFTLHARSCAFS